MLFSCIHTDYYGGGFKYIIAHERMLQQHTGLVYPYIHLQIQHSFIHAFVKPIFVQCFCCPFSAEEFLSDGVSMLNRLIEQGYYLPVLRVIGNVVPIMFRHRKLLINDQK